MHEALAGLLLLAATPTSAIDTSQAPAQVAEPAPPIVVTGIPIQDYRDRLDACLARACPTNEDVDATLALAEAMFLNGDYGEGRQVVRASISRNRRQAAAYPEPVSDLFRAHSRLSRHLGYDDQAARSTYNILRALRAGLPQEDHRHFTARMEIADLQMMMGNANRARGELRELAAVARASGREDVAVLAELRTIWFDYLVNRHGDAKSRLIDMAGAAGTGQGLRSTGAKILLARIYRSEGNAARADALLAEVGAGTSQRRRLISSPSYALQMQEVTNALDMVADSGAGPALANVLALGNVRNRIPDDFRDKWIDVGFWVLPDGRVSGLEVVRRSSSDRWDEPLMEAIQGRIYSTAPEATYRLERYTYTSSYETATGTRLPQHSPRARVEYMDLTANAPPTVPGAN